MKENHKFKKGKIISVITIILFIGSVCFVYKEIDKTKQMLVENTKKGTILQEETKKQKEEIEKQENKIQMLEEKNKSTRIFGRSIKNLFREGYEGTYVYKDTTGSMTLNFTDNINAVLKFTVISRIDDEKTEKELLTTKVKIQEMKEEMGYVNLVGVKFEENEVEEKDIIMIDEETDVGLLNLLGWAKENEFIGSITNQDNEEVGYFQLISK